MQTVMMGDGKLGDVKKRIERKLKIEILIDDHHPTIKNLSAETGYIH